MACATEQMPYTFLMKSKGQWTLWNGYLNGAAIVVENADAKTKEVLGIDLPPEEYDMYETTAGPEWGEYALWYFTHLDDRTVFRVRTRYETDVLIDVEAAEPLKSEAWEAELRARDRKEIMAILGDAELTMPSPQLTLGKAAKVHAAIVHAMHYEMDSALPLIQKLESVDYIGAGVMPSGSFTEQDPIDKEANFWHYTFYETRRLASLATRRFGATPKGYHAIGFLPKDKTDPISPTDRRNAAAKIRSGLAPKEVYEILGAPDYIPFDSWRYDVDGDSPYSLVLWWTEDGKVSRVEKAQPPLWEVDLHRSIDGRVLRSEDVSATPGRGQQTSRPETDKSERQTNDLMSPLIVIFTVFAGVVAICVVWQLRRAARH